MTKGVKVTEFHVKTLYQYHKDYFLSPNNVFDIWWIKRAIIDQIIFILVNESSVVNV